MEITGVILAGGKSHRMGQDKGLIHFGGKRLVEHAIELLQPLCSSIVISTNQEGYEQFGFKTIPDNYLDCGPVSGMEAALKQSQTGWNIVISCDTPFLQPELLTEMLGVCSSQDAIIPEWGKEVEPLAGIYHSRLATFFLQKIRENDFKVRRIIRERDVHYFNAEALLQKYPDLFYNVNTQEDLNL